MKQKIKEALEEWRDIEGYEGIYQVSNLGKVRGLDHVVTAISRWGTPQIYVVKGRLMKGSISTTGYPQVILSRGGEIKSHQIHRLVAKAFLDNPNNFPEVNHKNENKRDNRVCNLEWCDRDYNAHYKNACTRHAHKIWKKVRQLTIDGEYVAEYPSVSEAARVNGISVSYVSKIICGVIDNARGYRFELVNQ